MRSGRVSTFSPERVEQVSLTLAQQNSTREGHAPEGEGSLAHQEPFSTGIFCRVTIRPVMRTTLDDSSFTARPLLETRQTTDFERNFRQLEKTARRPYSLAKVIRELAQQPPRLTGFEQEVHQELSSLNHDRQVLGRYVVPARSVGGRAADAGADQCRGGYHSFP